MSVSQFVVGVQESGADLSCPAVVSLAPRANLPGVCGAPPWGGPSVGLQAAMLLQPPRELELPERDPLTAELKALLKQMIEAVATRYVVEEQASAVAAPSHPARTVARTHRSPHAP